MTSLCDNCARPGSCCTGFVLATGALDRGEASDIDALLATAVTCTNAAGQGSYLFGRGVADLVRACADPGTANVRIGLPYRRFYRAPDGRWRYWCPKLQRDGRCGDYANRPAACRVVQAGEAKPCCHYVPGIGACMDRAIDPFRRPASMAATLSRPTMPSPANAAPGAAAAAMPPP
jgi:hypothetical protein